jgi:hypothetical protein
MAISSESSSGPQQLFCEGHPHAKILVAEDPFINTFLRTVLQRRGHKVITSDASQASDFLRTGSVTVDVVITNDPIAFLPFADTVRMLYIAASPDPALASQFPHCRVLQKPFRNDELVEVVEELFSLVIP